MSFRLHRDRERRVKKFKGKKSFIEANHRNKQMGQRISFDYPADTIQNNKKSNSEWTRKIFSRAVCFACLKLIQAIHDGDLISTYFECLYLCNRPALAQPYLHTHFIWLYNQSKRNSKLFHRPNEYLITSQKFISFIFRNYTLGI